MLAKWSSFDAASSLNEPTRPFRSWRGQLLHRIQTDVGAQGANVKPRRQMWILVTRQRLLLRRVREEMLDSFDEAGDGDRRRPVARCRRRRQHPERRSDGGMDRRFYFRELFAQAVVKLRTGSSARAQSGGDFRGRDAAGKGGVIKRITQRLNPRVCRVAALPAPNERERTQWYFQRYVSHLPAAGEMVFFDRSWYNRAGVERVMGFCTDAEYEEFFRTVPEFERMLVRSGLVLIKYWFSITDDEQHLRFEMRIHDPLKQWKLSPMDLESRRRWELYTKAKEIMLERTHIAESRWWVVEAVDKKTARLNCIAHLLSQIAYAEVPHAAVELPKRIHNPDYHRGPVPEDLFVPSVY